MATGTHMACNTRLVLCLAQARPFSKIRGTRIYQVATKWPSWSWAHTAICVLAPGVIEEVLQREWVLQGGGG